MDAIDTGQMSSEDIIAQYPEAQAVLDANRHQEYKTIDDFLHQGFSLENRKKVCVLAGVVPVLIVIGVCIYGWIVEGYAVEVMVPMILLVTAMCLIATPLLRRQMDRKIDERNAQLALAAVRGEDLTRFLPKRYTTQELVKHPIEGEPFEPVDMAKVQAAQRAASMQMAAQVRAGEAPAVDDPGARTER